MLLVERNFETEVLTEGAGDQKNWFIKGVFAQAGVVNRNHRNYPQTIMEREVNGYRDGYVKTKRALGELEHPEIPTVNLKQVSHLIESIDQDGKNFVGKAKILNTPMGQIVRGLLEGGVKLGVSTRGTGSVKTNKQGIHEVQDDYKLATIDIVASPSAPDAFVEGLMEGEKYIWNTLEEDVEFLEGLKGNIKNATSKQIEEAKIKAFEKFVQRLAG